MPARTENQDTCQDQRNNWQYQFLHNSFKKFNKNKKTHHNPRQYLSNQELKIERKGIFRLLPVSDAFIMKM